MRITLFDIELPAYFAKKFGRLKAVRKVAWLKIANTRTVHQKIWLSSKRFFVFLQSQIIYSINTMLSLIKAASYIFNRYNAEFNTKIDEMKLHKLLYFTQRECIIMLNEPMFSDEFSAWKYGPVLVQIRDCYRWNNFTATLTDEERSIYIPVFDSAFANYAGKSSWSLSMLSHGEISWQRARVGIPQGANCSASMKLDDIKTDAERIRLRRFYFNEILPEIDSAHKG